LTQNEIKNLKDKLTKKEDLSNLKIKDLNMQDIIPQNIKDVIICVQDDMHTLVLPDGMDKHKFKTWRKGNGGVFNRDVLAFLREKDHGKYVLVEGEGERKIIRIIENDELHLFKALKLVNGIIKDKPFMLLKNLNENEKLSSTRRYIKENSEHEEEVETMIIDQQLPVGMEEDHDSVTSSVSLFDE